MSRNYISLAGDLQIIKKTMTPTEFKGYLKGRVLELRLACAEPENDVVELQKLIAVYSDELNSMVIEKKQTLEDLTNEDADLNGEDKDLSEKETETF